ncbi:MAG: hypothetical protein ACRC6K_04470, partial [Fusobacteriaceae bacterium]
TKEQNNYLELRDFIQEMNSLGEFDQGAVVFTEDIIENYFTDISLLKNKVITIKYKEHKYTAIAANLEDEISLTVAKEGLK